MANSSGPKPPSVGTIGTAITSLPAPVPRSVPGPLKTGSTFGPYEVLVTIGSGGMGTVYLAKHTVLNRDAALKVVHPYLLAAGPEVIQRFMREARAMAQVNHENVVRVYDVFQYEDSHAIAMEYIQGDSLATRLEAEEALTPEDVVWIMCDILKGLAAIHAEGLVHRDLKPANIVITDDDKVYIVDFGLALDPNGDTRLTIASTSIGTPRYMAPEQADPGATIDHRADLYALGVMTFHLLTGRPPYTGVYAHEILSQHAVAPIPAVVLPENRAMPAGLKEVIHKAMAKSPDERFQSADQMRDALERVLDAMSPEQASSPPVPQSAPPQEAILPQPSFRRARLGPPSRLIVIVVLLVLAATTAWFVVTRLRYASAPVPSDSPMLVTVPETASPPAADASVEMDAAVTPLPEATEQAPQVDASVVLDPSVKSLADLAKEGCAAYDRNDYQAAFTTLTQLVTGGGIPAIDALKVSVSPPEYRAALFCLCEAEHHGASLGDLARPYCRRYAAEHKKRERDLEQITNEDLKRSVLVNLWLKAARRQR